MSYGAYIEVNNSVGGTLSAKVYDGISYATWSTTGSRKGYTGFSYSATFTATPASGYEFQAFVIGIDTGDESYNSSDTARTSYDNPLTLPADYVSDGQSYCVIAMFKESEVVAEYSVTSKGTWSTSTSSKTVSVDSYTVLRYAYTPTSAGTLTFSSSTTGVDTIGWINNSATCVVDSNGYPSYYVGTYEDDASGTAFSATTEVSANTTYYLYVCCYSGGSGTVTLNVVFEGLGYTVTSMGTWSSSITSKSASVGSYQVLRYAYTPTKDGILTFSSSTTGTDTIGWIYNSTACTVTNSGYPSYYIGSYTDDASGTAFSATAEVSAYTTYYLYVCCYNGGSGTVTLSVNVANKRPSDWSWITTVAQGSQIALTAAEWNAFTSRINEFREYANLTTFSFTTAKSGVTPINATICNEAHVAIDAISGHGTLPAQLVLNGSLYASFFNGLKNALNAIP